MISIGGHVSDGPMAALHRSALGYGYIAPHRGEGGLGLSEAMSHGACVLATGWSGNMEFMDRSNSVPLNFILGPIGKRMVRMPPHFRPDMLWAAVDERHLEREMLRLVRRGPAPALCARARSVAERSAPSRLAVMLRSLILDALGAVRA